MTRCLHSIQLGLSRETQSHPTIHTSSQAFPATLIVMTPRTSPERSTTRLEVGVRVRVLRRVFCRQVQALLRLTAPRTGAAHTEPSEAGDRRAAPRPRHLHIRTSHAFPRSAFVYLTTCTRCVIRRVRDFLETQLTARSWVPRVYRGTTPGTTEDRSPSGSGPGGPLTRGDRTAATQWEPTAAQPCCLARRVRRTLRRRVYRGSRWCRGPCRCTADTGSGARARSRRSRRRRCPRAAGRSSGR